MQKKVLAVAFVLAPLLSVIAGTPFVSLGEANPLWFLGYVPPDEYTKAPVISIFSPENNTVFNTDNIVLSFKVDVGESETALSAGLNVIWYDTDWHHNNVDSFVHSKSSRYNNENRMNFLNSSSFSHSLNLTGIPEGNHSITVHAMEYGNYTHAPFLISSSETIFFTIDTNLQTGGNSNDYLLADPYGIIPEFPSLIILPLLITATLFIIICKQKLPKTPNN